MKTLTDNNHNKRPKRPTSRATAKQGLRTATRRGNFDAMTLPAKTYKGW